MGCNSSKTGVDTVAYRPAPTSFAVFDINSIQEPWILLETMPHDQKQHTHMPAQILDKLNSFESDPAPPNSWVEVSKVLDDLKPTFQPAPKPDPTPNPKPIITPSPPEKSDSKKLRTLEELDAKLIAPKPEPKKPSLAGKGATSLKHNMFIVMDKQEREKEGKAAIYEKMIQLRKNPLGEFPEICPPGGEQSVVVYTTSLRGIRRTYEDCTRVRSIFELQRVVFDERDVSLHGGFRGELKELVGEEVGVPRVFVKGRYLGGADEVAELNETGRLGRILTYAGVERGVGRMACEGCGGARFMPCLGCGGSCRVVAAEGGCKERCSECNENGLVMCPVCL